MRRGLPLSAHGVGGMDIRHTIAQSPETRTDHILDNRQLVSDSRQWLHRGIPYLRIRDGDRQTPPQDPEANHKIV